MSSLSTDSTYVKFTIVLSTPTYRLSGLSSILPMRHLLTPVAFSKEDTSSSDNLPLITCLRMSRRLPGFNFRVTQHLRRVSPAFLHGREE